MPDITHHSNDQEPGALRYGRAGDAEADAPAKRFFVRKVLAHELLINDGHWAPLLIVLRAERTTSRQAHAQRAEIIRVDDAKIGVRLGARRSRGLAFDHKPP